MIINHEHKLAFIHIPKCAGTTLRQYLKNYDSLDGAFSNRVSVHEKLGKLDYVHIPLFVLQSYFPDEFLAVRNYWSFAIIRDPYARFASSVSQRLRMYGRKTIQEMSKKEVLQEIDNCIAYLGKNSSNEALLKPDFIHFQRQRDYVFCGKLKIVDNVYATENIEDLVEALEHRIGRVFRKIEGNESETKNKTLVYRNDVYKLLLNNRGKVFDLMIRLMPNHFINFFKKRAYVGRDVKLSRVFSEKYIVEFVREYYSDDLSLYKDIAGGR